MEIKKEISNIMLQIGVSLNLSGNKYLCEAIELVYNSPNLITNVTKQLYPKLATKFNTVSANIERSIRHAIEVAWNKNKLICLNKIFGLEIFNENDKPGNAEFIALIADRLKYLTPQVS